MWRGVAVWTVAPLPSALARNWSRLFTRRDPLRPPGYTGLHGRFGWPRHAAFASHDSATQLVSLRACGADDATNRAPSLVSERVFDVVNSK